MVEFAVVMAVVLVFILGLVYGLNAIDRKRSPLEHLRERYAKGEIDDAEFTRSMTLLELEPGELDD